MRVLLIEDEPTTARAIELMLTTEGFNVYSTDLGEEGLDLGKLYDYDIILLDLNLPDIHGLEVIKLMQAEQALAAIPIVVISGERSIVAARAIALGATAFHAKPLDFGELLETLHSLDSSSPQPVL